MKKIEKQIGHVISTRNRDNLEEHKWAQVCKVPGRTEPAAIRRCTTAYTEDRDSRTAHLFRRPASPGRSDRRQHLKKNFFVYDVA